ncbi:MAG: PD40 domain-containing protein, partial [Bryobacterales bacterium]|nr:PD40 domain-containing protein [Bryobacterales bacterium]
IGALVVGALVGLGVIQSEWVSWLLFSVFSVASLVILRPPLRRLMTADRGNGSSVDTMGGETAIVVRGPQHNNVDIYLLQIGTDTPARLTTHPAEDHWGVFSPDGTRMAFLRHSEETAVSIILTPVPANEERLFAKISRAPRERPRLDWSSDGKYLVANERMSAGQPSRLVVFDAATAERRQLTSPPEKTLGDSEAVFSPDGKQIAFRRTLSSGIEDVYVISTSGGEPRRITQDNRGISAIAWTPDASALLVSTRRRGSTREIWRFRLSGGEPKRLTSPALDAGGQAVSRDGSRVVFVQSAADTNIYQYDLTGRAEPRRLADSTLVDGGPVLSPDGRQFAYRSTRSGAEEFWIGARDGSHHRRLTSLGGPAVGGIRWSPDGKRLAFDVRIEPHSDCYLIDADGSNLRRFHTETTNESSPSFSGDGQYLYFASNRSGGPEIWRQPLAGGTAEQLTSGGGNQAIEAPDGKTLYYARRTPPEIRSLRLDGQFPTPGNLLVPMENGAYGKWSVTSAGIYFSATDTSRPEPLRIRLLPHASVTVRDIAPVPRQATVVDGNISVDEEGKQILIGLLDRSGSGLILADLK